MQRKKSFLSALLSLVAIPIIVIVILIDKPDNSFFNFIHKAIVPVAQFVGQGLSYPIRLVGKMTEGIRKNREVLKENAKIRADLETLQKITAENELLMRENELLREKLKITENIKHETAVAKIIHNNSFAEKQNFIIKNPNDGVFPGNVVVSNSGYLLGIIVEKTGGFAKIRSIRDGDSNIPVRIAGTDIFGFLQGVGTSDPELRFLSNGDFIPQAGMFLVTSGVNGNIPDDIPVGRIEKVEPDEIRVKIGGELKDQENVTIMFFDRGNKYE